MFNRFKEICWKHNIEDTIV